ncbi:hypothetical protein ACLOJK_019400, partial [Asimina triloba]
RCTTEFQFGAPSSPNGSHGGQTHLPCHRPSLLVKSAASTLALARSSMAERGQQWQPQKSGPNLADLRPHPTPSMAMESMQLASSSGITQPPSSNPWQSSKSRHGTTNSNPNREFPATLLPQITNPISGVPNHGSHSTHRRRPFRLGLTGELEPSAASVQAHHPVRSKQNPDRSWSHHSTQIQEPISPAASHFPSHKQGVAHP